MMTYGENKAFDTVYFGFGYIFKVCDGAPYPTIRFLNRVHVHNPFTYSYRMLRYSTLIA